MEKQNNEHEAFITELLTHVAELIFNHEANTGEELTFGSEVDMQDGRILSLFLKTKGN